jgi:hypothetical protein
MPTPATREQFKDHCLRSLGAPVVEINVDDDQVEDRVDEALQFWNYFHDDSTEKHYFKHLITSTDVTNEYITIDNTDLIQTVVRVAPIGFGGGQFMNYRYELKKDIHALLNLNAGGNLKDYYVKQTYAAMLDLVMGSDAIHFDYNPHKNQIKLEVDWTEFPAGEYLVLECYRVIDPEVYTDAYNDYYLKRYAAALIKRQWGTNLSKFDGIQMPGGVTFNGKQIFDEAMEEIIKLEEECRLTWEMPTDFYTG